MKENKSSKKTKVNEPEAVYLKKKLTFYESFEEENEDMIKYWASLDGITHLKNVTALINQVYKEELERLKTMPKKLTFYK